MLYVCIVCNSFFYEILKLNQSMIPSMKLKNWQNQSLKNLMLKKQKNKNMNSRKTTMLKTPTTLENSKTSKKKILVQSLNLNQKLNRSLKVDLNQETDKKMKQKLVQSLRWNRCLKLNPESRFYCTSSKRGAHLKSIYDKRVISRILQSIELKTAR